MYKFNINNFKYFLFFLLLFIFPNITKASETLLFSEEIAFDENLYTYHNSVCVEDIYLLCITKDYDTYESPEYIQWGKYQPYQEDFTYQKTSDNYEFWTLVTNHPTCANDRIYWEYSNAGEDQTNFISCYSYSSQAELNAELGSYVSLTFTTPSNSAYIEANQSGTKTFTFEGTCPEDAEDELAISYDLIDSIDIDETTMTAIPINDQLTFDIDCVDNEWSKTLPVKNGETIIWLYTKHWQDDPNHYPFTSSNIKALVYNGYVINQSAWSLTLPQDDGNHNIKVQAETSYGIYFPYAYQIPPGVNRSEVTFKLKTFSSQANQYLDNSPSTVIDDTLNDLDTNDRGYVLDQRTVASGSTYYWTAILIYKGNGVFVLPLQVYGCTSSDITCKPNTYQPTEWGSWTWLKNLLMPGKTVMDTFRTNIEDKLMYKKPFSYYSQVRQELLMTVNDNVNINLGFELPVANQNVNVSILDMTSQPIQDFSSGIKTVLVAAMWLNFAGYVAFRIINLTI